MHDQPAYLCDGNIEIQSKAQNHTGDQHDKHRKGSILKISKLYFHAAELDTPSNIRVRWWRLESYSLPVGRLDILI